MPPLVSPPDMPPHGRKSRRQGLLVSSKTLLIPHLMMTSKCGLPSRGDKACAAVNVRTVSCLVSVLFCVLSTFSWIYISQIYVYLFDKIR